MRILVIGGTGFIGTPLVARFAALGHKVAVFSRGQKPASLPDGVQHIIGERLKFADAASAIEAFGPDITVDIFAMTLQETAPVFDLMAGLGGRFVMLSSCDVYRVFGRILKTEPGDVLEGSITETSPLREKLYPYRELGHVKAETYDKIPIEQKCFEQFGNRGTVMRLPMIVGRGDPQHRFRDPVKHMADGRPAILLPEVFANWRTTYGYIDNVIEAIVCAALDPRSGGEVFNVGDTPVRTMAEWYGLVAKVMEWRGDIIIKPAEALPTKRAGLEEGGNLNQDIWIDALKLQKVLDFKPPVGQMEGLAHVVAWEKEGLGDVPEEAFDYGSDDTWLNSRT